MQLFEKLKSSKRNKNIVDSSSLFNHFRLSVWISFNVKVFAKNQQFQKAKLVIHTVLHHFFCSLIQNFGRENQHTILVAEDEKFSFLQKTHYFQRVKSTDLHHGFDILGQSVSYLLFFFFDFSSYRFFPDKQNLYVFCSPFYFSWEQKKREDSFLFGMIGIVFFFLSGEVISCCLAKKKKETRRSFHRSEVLMSKTRGGTADAYPRGPKLKIRCHSAPRSASRIPAEVCRTLIKQTIFDDSDVYFSIIEYESE